jgi:hypothetical protein
METSYTLQCNISGLLLSKGQEIGVPSLPVQRADQAKGGVKQGEWTSFAFEHPSSLERTHQQLSIHTSTSRLLQTSTNQKFVETQSEQEKRATRALRQHIPLLK